MAHDLNILVAEPNEASRAIIKKIFQDNGFERVAFTANPDQVLAILGKGVADFLLIDWSVAGAGGMGLLHAIDAKRKLARVPKLLMGERIPVAGLDEAFKYGVRDYVRKPFTPYVLMVKFDKIMFGGYQGAPRHDVRRTPVRGVQNPDENPELAAAAGPQADPAARLEVAEGGLDEPQRAADPNARPEVSSEALPEGPQRAADPDANPEISSETLPEDPALSADPDAHPELAAAPLSQGPRLSLDPNARVLGGAGDAFDANVRTKQQLEVAESPLPDETDDAQAARNADPHAAPEVADAPLPGEPPQYEKSENVKEREAAAKKLFDQAMEHLEFRRYPQAMKLFARAVRLKRLFPEAYKGIADAFRGQGDIERASQFMNKAAETYAWLDMHEEAEATYNYVKKVDPTAPNPYKVVGDHLRNQADRREVLGVYERAAKLSPKDKSITISLARAHAENGHKKRAANLLRPLVAREDAPDKLKGLYLQLDPSGLPELRGIQFLEETKAKNGSDRRKYRRVPLVDYAARMPLQNESYTVIDMTIAGIGFKPGSGEFEVGQELTFDLVAMGDPKLSRVAVVVRRVMRTVIGCEFKKLSPKQHQFVAHLVGHRDASAK